MDLIKAEWKRWKDEKMNLIKVVWTDEKGRRATSYIPVPKVTGEIIEVSHTTVEKMDELSGHRFGPKK